MTAARAEASGTVADGETVGRRVSGCARAQRFERRSAKGMSLPVADVRNLMLRDLDLAGRGEGNGMSCDLLDRADLRELSRIARMTATATESGFHGWATTTGGEIRNAGIDIRADPIEENAGRAIPANPYHALAVPTAWGPNSLKERLNTLAQTMGWQAPAA